MSIDLKQKIEAWIRAEFLFRFADRSYTQEAQEWLLQAEGELRQAVAGCEDLYAAGKRIGCKSNMIQKRIVPKQRQKLQPANKSRVVFKRKGLF